MGAAKRGESGEAEWGTVREATADSRRNGYGSEKGRAGAFIKRTFELSSPTGGRIEASKIGRTEEIFARSFQIGH